MFESYEIDSNSIIRFIIGRYTSSQSMKSRIFPESPGPPTDLMFSIHDVLNAIWLPQCWATTGALVAHKVI